MCDVFFMLLLAVLCLFCWLLFVWCVCVLAGVGKFFFALRFHVCYCLIFIKTINILFSFQFTHYFCVSCLAFSQLRLQNYQHSLSCSFPFILMDLFFRTFPGKSRTSQAESSFDLEHRFRSIRTKTLPFFSCEKGASAIKVTM